MFVTGFQNLNNDRKDLIGFPVKPTVDEGPRVPCPNSAGGGCTQEPDWMSAETQSFQFTSCLSLHQLRLSSPQLCRPLASKTGQLGT